MSRRVDRINGLLREEISNLILREIKDPRLHGVLTITQVQTSSDLRNAKVYISVMGDHGVDSSTLEGIRSAASFMRKQLRERLRLKYVPFLTFEIDNSLEDSQHIFGLMDRALQESGPSPETIKDISNDWPLSSASSDI